MRVFAYTRTVIVFSFWKLTIREDADNMMDLMNLVKIDSSTFAVKFL